jgi:CheY-like chemotaxis protein
MGSGPAAFAIASGPVSLPCGQRAGDIQVQAKKRVLWVEDSARFELASVLGPIFASHRYDLTLAENASTAAEYLRRRQFDAIIVDIRLPPGPHRYWRGIYKGAGSDRTNAKLGLELLSWLLAGGAQDGKGKSKRADDSVPARPAWQIAPDHIGVFSVENRGEIGGDLEALGVSVQHEKRPGLPDTILLDIVTEILGEAE